MTIQLDDLLDTEVPDFKRDRWGRPHILQPDGKRKGYTRCSSAAKTIEDTFNLEKWARRNVAYGLAHDASLVARILAIGGEPSTWDKPDKDAVNDVVEAAEQVAKAHKAADIGTAVHRLTEKLDRGETVVGGPYQADLDAYTATMRSYGFVVDPRYVECRMVNDDLEMAGTADRIIQRPDGTWAIADIKTSATVEFGGLGWAAQLAAYATGTLYDVDSEQRQPTPDIDKQVGYIIHLPAGQGRCDIYQVDLAAGLDAARLANQIRATRKASKDWIKPYTPAPQVSPAPTEPAPAAQPEYTKQSLIDRYNALKAADPEFEDRFKALEIPRTDYDAVHAALLVFEKPKTTIERATERMAAAPAKPVPDDVGEGGPASDDDEAVMRAFAEFMGAEQRAWVGAITSAPIRHGRSIRYSYAKTKRRADICIGLANLAQSDYWGDIDAALRIVLYLVTDDNTALQAGASVPDVLAQFDSEQAAQFREQAQILTGDVDLYQELRKQMLAA